MLEENKLEIVAHVLAKIVDRDKRRIDRKNSAIRRLGPSVSAKRNEIRDLKAEVNLYRGRYDKVDKDNEEHKKLLDDIVVALKGSEVTLQHDEILEAVKAKPTFNKRHFKDKYEKEKAKASKLNAEKLEFMSQVKHYIGNLPAYKTIITRYKEVLKESQVKRNAKRKTKK